MPPPAANRAFSLSTGSLLVLAFLQTAAPMSTDIYIPAFPRVQGDYRATASEVQLTLTGFFLGLACGQLCFGALSDRCGRIVPLLFGNVLTIGASVIAALAPSIEVLIAARLAQGLGAAAGLVIGQAILMDLTRGPETARMMSLMGTIGGAAPVLAPSIGALLEGPIGWRGLMWALAGLFVIMMGAVALVLRETRPAEARRTASLIGGLGQVIDVPRYRLFVLLFATTFAAMIGYVSASSFVYQEVMGFTALQYGIAFGINAAGMISSAYIASRLARSVGPLRIVKIAVPAALGFSVLVLIIAVLPVPRWFLALPIWLTVSTMGFIQGNLTALALEAVRHVSGSGAAGLGFTQFIFGAAATPLSGLGGAGTPIPMGLLMATATGIATLLLATAIHRGSLRDDGLNGRSNPAYRIEPFRFAPPRPATEPDTTLNTNSSPPAMQPPSER